MNHIIKVIQFYKTLKENDINAINYLFGNSKNNEHLINHRKIAIENLHFFTLDQTHENNNCKFCFESIYNNLLYIPLQLSNRYFYLKQAKIQIFDKHFAMVLLPAALGPSIAIFILIPQILLLDKL